MRLCHTPAVSSDGRIYGGQSAANRRADRRQRLTDSGLDLIGEGGVADLTVGDVCTRAQLSKRYFYEEFESITQLVDAVMDLAVDHLAEVVFAPSEIEGSHLPRHRLASFVDALTSDPRLARLVLVETLGGGPLAGRRAELVHRSVELLLEDFLSPSHDRLSEHERVLAAYALSGATSELLVAWIENDLAVTADEIVDFLAELFSRISR